MTGAEYFVLVATCVTYIGLGGMAGLMVGLIFTCLAFVIEQSSLDSALLVDSVDRGRSLSSVGLTAELSPGVLIAARKQNVTISLQGNIFFATTHSLTKEILRNVDAHGPASMGCVLLNFKRVQSVDISAIHTLAQLAAELGTRGWELKSTGLRSRLAKRFAKLGLIVVNAALVSPAGMAPASMDEENGTVSAASTLSDIPTGPDSSSHSLERDSRTPCRTLLQHLAHAEEHVELPVPRSGSGLLRYAVLNDSVESFAPLSGRPPLIPGGYDSGHGSGHGSFNPGGLRYQMANDSVESLHAFGGLGQRRNSPMFHGAHDLKELPPPLEQDESVTAPLGLHSHPLSKSAEERVDDAGGCECAGAVSVPDDLSKFEELFKSLGVVEFVPAQFVVLQANDVVVATEVIFLLEGDAIQWRARRTNTGEATDFSRASLKRAGNMLGATEVILGTSRHFSAHMLTDGQIVRLTVKHMREIRASRPEVWEMLILKALQGSTNIVREFLFLQEE
ncbi:hypothetical protein T492DRAFT_192330 [Pavlovales sp. CCMP2436]|nr:hypothetical protein T492DRAFT_192330 [Pavlovales sp. CCMP2436]